MKRRVYLSMEDVREAREKFLSRVGRQQRTGEETVPTEEALGRITAAPVFARFSAPTFHSAAMDGIAVKAENTYGAAERRPRILALDRDAVWINTGQKLPRGFDSVIMVEKLHQLDERQVEIRAPSHPWQNVRKVGEDVVATQLLFPQNHRIRPYDLGALAGAGVQEVSVWKRPCVAIIPTGSDLIHHTAATDEERVGDRIIEYNSLVLAGLIRECDGIPMVYDIVPDREEDLRNTLQQAVGSEAHLIIINAGSSAGSKDFTFPVLDEMGEILVHGVAMMPGKPTILGMIGGTPVVGNPGYAVSSALSFEQFVKPLLYSLQGASPRQRQTADVQPTRDIPSKLGMEEFLRVNIGKVGEHYVATPLARAAGSITTLTRAEGVIRIPPLSEGVSRKERIAAELLVDEHELLNTLVVIGSHDITLDVLADEIRRAGTGIRIVSSNVGSLGGLMALRRETCHMAGSHLLDTETGEYNTSYIRRYLKGLPVCVFHLVLREQGLMVRKGNPKRIQRIEDLARSEVSIVNRQAGSGTRILLDYKLQQAGIPPESVAGYDHEEFTHMAVAVDVLSGAADTGMGIFAAAKALGLEFIALEQEQYDLIIPAEMTTLPNVKRVLETIGSVHFRERVLSLGGYDPSRSGELRVELN